ncbi:MAG: HemK2/MTQ2 family protein methyltransferase [Candidatus Micrarchaeia archaeon]
MNAFKNNICINPTMYIYEPADDSYLLADELKNRKCKRFLDMGTGNGIQANCIGNADEIVCVDINPQAVESAKTNVKRENVKFIISDLFTGVEGKFDLIAFNTPYLDDSEPRDICWTHIQNGEDIIMKFLNTARNNLAENGSILMVISDRGYEKYKRYALGCGYSWNVIRERQLFFEKIYLVELK